MSDYFDGDPIPEGADSNASSNYFKTDIKPIINVGEKVDPVLTTGKGKDTSLIPIEGSSWLDLLNNMAKVQGLTLSPLATAVREEKGEGPLLSKEISKFSRTMDLMKDESDRIENVLKDLYGKTYAGKEEVGGISGWVRDGLARRNKFHDRHAYFKKHYPEGKYFRTNVGGTKTEELYQLTEGGLVHRVDPDGGFSDFSGDFADFLGTVATFSTAGSVVGSFFSPFLGTAGGASAGQMIDDYLTDEGVEIEGGKEFWQTYSNDKALQATLEGAINKVLPGLGRFLVGKMRNEGGVPFNFMVGKTQPTALAAQKYAQKSNLPLLSIAQLTDNKVIKRLSSQLAGTSDALTKNIDKQKLALYNKLKKEIGGDFNNVSQEKLIAYLDLKKKYLIDQTVEIIKKSRLKDQGFEGEDQIGKVDFRELLSDINLFKEGYDTLIENKFKLAMQTAKKNKVVFNLKDIVKTAEDILSDVPIKMKEKGVGGTNIYQRIGGELQGDIKNLLTQLRAADPNVGTIAVETFGTKRTYDALKQMLTIRNKLSEIAGESGDKNAIAMIKAIDNTLETPMNGGKDFMKHLTDARKLVKDKSDVVNYSSLSTLFDRTAGINIDKTMKALYAGKIDAEDINILAKFMNISEGVTNQSSKQSIQKTTQKTMQKLQDGFIQFTLQNKETAGKVLQDLMRDNPKLFEKLVPHAGTRQALKDLSIKHAQLNSSGAQQALTQAMNNSEYAFETLARSTQKEIMQMIADKGGINSKFANEIRRAILKKIATKGNMADAAEGTGEVILDTNAFASELAKLTSGLGDYAKFKGLFPPKYVKALNDRRLYSFFTAQGPDAGAEIATGAVVGKLRQGEPIAFAKTMFVSNLLSSFLAHPPSVAQLQKAHDNRKFFRSDKILNVMTSILTSIERELDLLDETYPFDRTPGNIETLEQEVDRTKKSPFMGDKIPIDKVSSNTITPNTLNLNLPNVSSGGGTVNPPTKSTTNYASLFPFDTTGRTISDRQGIMGLA